jgi:hypothetical protein
MRFLAPPAAHAQMILSTPGTGFLPGGADLETVNDTQVAAVLAAQFGSALVPAILSAYPKDPVDLNTPGYRAAAIVTDEFFVCPSRRVLAAAERAAGGASDSLFMWNFAHIPNWVNPDNFIFAAQVKFRVAHTSEIWFVFGHPPVPAALFPLPFTAEEEQMSAYMRSAWVKFATTGRAPWKPWSSSLQSFRLINTTDGGGIRDAANFHSTRCTFWDQNTAPAAPVVPVPTQCTVANCQQCVVGSSKCNVCSFGYLLTGAGLCQSNSLRPTDVDYCTCSCGSFGTVGYIRNDQCSTSCLVGCAVQFPTKCFNNGNIKDLCTFTLTGTKLSAGVIAGVAVASIAFIAIAAFCWWRRRKAMNSRGPALLSVDDRSTNVYQPPALVAPIQPQQMYAPQHMPQQQPMYAPQQQQQMYAPQQQPMYAPQQQSMYAPSNQQQSAHMLGYAPVSAPPKY